MSPTIKEIEEQFNLDLQCIKEAQTIPGVTVCEAFGSVVRGDYIEGVSDLDFLLFVEGEKYNTPSIVFDYKEGLPKEPKKEIGVYNVEEAKEGLFSLLHSTRSRSHLLNPNNTALVFGESITDRLRKRNPWSRLKKELNIDGEHITGLSAQLHSIRELYPRIKKLIQSKNSGQKAEYLYDDFKKVKSTAIYRTGLETTHQMPRYPEKDDNTVVINKFFDIFPGIEEYRSSALESREVNINELSERQALDFLNKSKERGEAIIHAVDQYYRNQLNAISS